MVFGEIESLLSLLDRGRTFFSKNGERESSTIAQRFVKLFEAHGVHRNQIPRLLPGHLSIANVADNDAITTVLADGILDAACDLFAINREWLDGASDQIYPLHDFYKRPQDFKSFITSIQDRSKTNSIGVVLRSSASNNEESALIVLEEGIAILGEKPIYRYHICNNWIHDYWKSRAYMTACVAIAWNQNFYLSGRDVPIETIRKYCTGESFLEYHLDSALPMQGPRWEPEEMAINPNAYLADIAREINDFGVRSALELWLKLDEKGLMETRLPSSNVRSQFISALGGTIGETPSNNASVP